MSQFNLDYSMGPALTMEDLHVPELDAPLSLSDLDVDVSVIEGDDTPMTISELEDSIFEDDNDKPFTLSELDVSIIEKCDETGEITTDDLETVVIDNDDCECAVCLEPINKNKNIAITKCKHTFCFQCIGQTLMDVGNNCPLCRAELVEYNNDDESLGSEDSETELDEDDNYISDDESVYSVSNLGRNYDNELETSIVRIRAMGFDKGPIKEITDRFMEKGYTCYDLMTILFQQYDKNTTKDDEAIATHVTKSIEDLNDIHNEEREIVEMAEQDIAVV
jgi:hypothetical protein